MNKFIQFIAIAFLLACPLVIVGQSSLGIEGKTTHPDLTDGLKQFPAKYPTSRGYVRATVYGFGVGNPITENGKVFNSKFLMLATEDGQNLNIQVVGPEIELALFMQEVRPFTGEHKFWNPVLEFKGKHNDWVYSWYEIEVVGRFYMETDRDSNKVTGYQNKVYR